MAEAQATLQDLDAKIAELNSTTATTFKQLSDSLSVDFQSLMAKINQNPPTGVDYSAEVSAVAAAISTINTAATSLAATDSAAQAVLNPPPQNISEQAARPPAQPPFAKNPVNQSVTNVTGEGDKDTKGKDKK